MKNANILGETINNSQMNIQHEKINPDKVKDHTCVDMHFHTVHSDGAATVKETLKKIRKLGIGVAITDHNEIAGVLEAYEKKEDSDLVIPGIEVKSVELVDILFYFNDLKDLKKFYEKEIKPKKDKYFFSTKTLITLSELIELSKKYDCLTSVAHPYGYNIRSSLQDVFKRYEKELKKFKIFEAINGGNPKKANEKAIKYIEKNKKGFTGGSDGHSIFDLGRVITCSKSSNIKDFLTQIENKKNLVIGDEIKFSKLGQYGNFAANKLKNVFTR